MSVDKLRILKTKCTPEIDLNPDGMIIIRGRLLVYDVTEFSMQFEGWIDKYICCPSEITCVDFHIDYLPTSSLRFYISFLSKIISVKLLDKKLIINWYYEEGDNDILEKGENISALFNITFNFIEIFGSNITELQPLLVANIDI